MKKYLDYVASKGCLVCRQPADIHHIIVGNVAGRLPKDDRMVVPLCKYHHQDQKFGIHGDLFVEMEIGRRLTANQRFFMHYGIDLYDEAKKLWSEYNARKGTL